MNRLQNHLARTAGHHNPAHHNSNGPHHNPDGHHADHHANNHHDHHGDHLNNHNGYNRYGRNWHHWWGWSSWGGLGGWFGPAWFGASGAAPLFYDYGPDGNVVYDGGNIVVNGQPAGTAQDYAQQAIDLAQRGEQAEQVSAADGQLQVAQAGNQADAADTALVDAQGDPTGSDSNEAGDVSTGEESVDEAEWVPLGVFALSRDNAGDEEPKLLFQLAVNKEGRISGTAIHPGEDTSEPIYGAVDRETQRAAWSVGERRNTVYETGLFNLTQSETPVLIHLGTQEHNTALLVHLHPPQGALGEPDEVAAPSDESVSARLVPALP